MLARHQNPLFEDSCIERTNKSINCLGTTWFTQGMQGRSLAGLIKSGGSAGKDIGYSVTVKDGRFYAGTRANFFYGFCLMVVNSHLYTYFRITNCPILATKCALGDSSCGGTLSAGIDRSLMHCLTYGTDIRPSPRRTCFVTHIHPSISN